MTTRSALLAVCAALTVSAAPAARAQAVRLEALVDLELWKTDDSSRLLARNDGKWASLARLRTWAAWQPLSSVDVLVLGSVESGSASPCSRRSASVITPGGTSSPPKCLEHTTAAVELARIRYVGGPALTIDAGRILMPVGSFGRRRLSNVNPLIGAPDMYPPLYPWGATASGLVGSFDYLAGVVSLPAVNPNYTPPPDEKARPVVALGWHFGAPLRIGVSATRGPYLGNNVSSYMGANTRWWDYEQAMALAEFRYAISDFELRGEVAWSRYEVPTKPSDIHGFGWYGEGRYTITPRLFAAARYERFEYPFVLPVNSNFWVGTTTTEMNGEAGLGYRLNEESLFKVSFRKDHWPVHRPNPSTYLPDGYAFAAQLSLHADLLGWLDP